MRVDRLDNMTGNAGRVISESAPVVQGNYVQRALAHVQAISPALGLTDDPDERPAEFISDT